MSNQNLGFMRIVLKADCGVYAVIRNARCIGHMILGETWGVRAWRYRSFKFARRHLDDPNAFDEESGEVQEICLAFKDHFEACLTECGLG